MLLAADRLARLAAKACRTMPDLILAACQAALTAGSGGTSLLATPAALIDLVERLVRSLALQTTASSTPAAEAERCALVGAAHSCGRAAHALAQLVAGHPAAENIAGAPGASPAALSSRLAKLTSHLASWLPLLLQRQELPDAGR